MAGLMRLRIWDVEHGACAMLHHVDQTIRGDVAGKLAMIDSGHTADWRPSTFIRQTLGRTRLDYLFITNADQDHMSDLQGLWDEGVYVDTLFRNNTYTGSQMRSIKARGGPLTDDAKRYVAACDTYSKTSDMPFADHMGGIRMNVFCNSYPTFTDTNNLSLVVFIMYANFKILFPGDLEMAGWQALVQRADFRSELAGTDVLVASHHGRENGYCEDIFKHFTPACVVVSDKPIVHATQEMVPDYRKVVRAQGVRVRTTMKDRHVLTTRRDGWIQFDVDDQNYTIDTEYRG